MITINGVRYNNDFRPSQDLDYLISCVGERVAIEVDFSYQDLTYSSTTVDFENDIILEPTNDIINLADNTGVVFSEDGAAFTNYYVGDSVSLWNTVSFIDTTVTEKIDNGTIRVAAALTPGTMANGSYVYNATPFAGVRFAYNLIDSGNSFNSLIDGEYQQGEIATASATTLTNQNLNFTGIKSYQIGSLQIKGLGTEGINGATGGGNDNIKQLFTITHNIVITPFFLASQYNDLLSAVKPAYFEAQSTLNYIAQLSLGRNLTNPNKIQTLDVSTNKSNVGWFNENFNGGLTNYSVSSVILTRVSDSEVISQLEFANEIEVELIIDNTVDSPFSSGNTQYTFGFNFLPETEDLYQNNGFDQTRNFLFDSKSNTLGSGSVNGDNFGTSLQVIKSVTSTFISATQMKVTATIQTGSAADDIIQQGDAFRYDFWLITENHALADEVSDKVNLLASVNEFDLQLHSTNVIVNDGTTFITHPYTDDLDGLTAADLKPFPVDDIVANTNFHIDYNPSPGTTGEKAQFIFPYGQMGSVVNDYQIIINGKTVATSAWQGSTAATATNLALSLNTGSQFVPPFNAVGQPQIWPFDGTTGFTATIGTPAPPFNIWGTSIIITAPIAGVLYNNPQPIGAAKFSFSQALIRSVEGVDDETSFANTGAKITSVQSKLILRDGDGFQADMPLESFNFSTANFPIIGLAQEIAFSQDRVFKIPASIRKTISMSRDYANDVAFEKYYNYQYPFMHRWEYWVAILNLTTTPASLYDNSLPNNGINHFWHRYTTVGSWHIDYDLIFTIEQNGVEFTQTFTERLADSRDFDDNTDWTNNSIKSYDLVTAAEIVNAGTKYIYGYEDVRIEAEFEKTTGPVPDLANVGIVIWIETFEDGGISDIRRISSFYPTGTDTWFKSIDTSDMVEVTKVGSVFTGKCLVDYTKLPINVQFTIYARIYEFQGGESKQFMDGVDFDFMDDVQYNFM